MAKSAKNRDLNLLLALDRTKVKAQGGSSIKLLLLLFVLLVLAFAAAAVFYFFETADLQDIKNTSEIYLNDPSVQASYDEAGRAQAQAMQMQSESSELTGAIANLKTYPDLTSAQWKKIFRIAGGRIDLSGFSYDRTTGLLTFSASTESATRVPLFVAELRTSKIFSDVTYEGYAGGSTSTPGTPIIDEETGMETPGDPIVTRSYAFNVSCQVNAPATKAK